MDIKIELATLRDVPLLEKISSKAYEKFELKGLHYDYEKETVLHKLKQFITTKDFYVYTASLDRIVGYIILFEATALFSSQKQLHEIAMQSDPELSEFTQSRIIIKLIDFVTEYGEKNKLDLTSISIMEAFDIEKTLIKKNYKLSDKIYIRKVGGL